MRIPSATRRLVPLTFLFLAFIAALAVGSHTGTSAPPALGAYCDADAGPATVTNKEEFSPNETATIRGCGFNAYFGQTVTVRVTEPDLVVFEDTAAPDSEGDFWYDYVVPGKVGTYQIEILSGSTVLATNSFLDAYYVDPTTLTFVAVEGTNAASQSFQLVVPSSCKNTSGTSTATDNQTWMSETPASWTTSGYSSGPGSDYHIDITVNISSSALAMGTYTGTVTVDPRGSSCTSNKTLPITLHVIKPNPTLSQSCGVDMVLVIDNSGSISASELSQMKTALNSFVGAFLPATPTQIAVVVFNTSASVTQAFTSDATTATNAVNAVPTSSGFTNWDDALYDARNLFPNRAANPDLIVVATDGNPTEWGGNSGDPLTQDSGGVTALAKAIAEANTAKTNGARILTLGIGNDLSPQNLAAISSPDAVTTADFGTLAASLAAIANSQCGGTITVQKVLDADGNTATTGDQTPGVGWTVTTSVSTTPPNADDTVTPASGTTDSDGKKNFALGLGANATSTATVSETLQANHAFISAACTGASNNGSQSGNGVSGIVVVTNNIVNCKIYNKPPAIFTVNKVWSPASASSVSVTVTCTSGTVAGGTQSVSTASPKTWTVTAFTGTPNCTATESPVPTGYTGSGSPAGTCTAGLLSPGNCTITNTRNDATFTVSKVFSPASGASVSVSVTCTSGAVTGGTQSVTTASPKSWTIQGYTAGATCTATESPIPSGYGASGSPAGTCTASLPSPAACTITNTLSSATFTVNKVWSPASGASVAVTVACASGTPVEGSQNVSTASPKTWTINGFSGTPSCTATETVPAGYTGSGSPAGTCTAGLVSPGNCTITNIRNDTTFTVNKVWSPASASSVSVTVTCTGGGTVVEGAQSVTTASPKTWNIQGYSSTPTCTATETIPSGYSASGSPAGTCSGTAPGSCTITNTRNDATFTVNKVWSPASAASVSVTVSCTGGGTLTGGTQSVSTASPKTWTITGYTSTPTCTATESPIPTGYSASGSPAGTCSGTVSGGTGSCTITNTRNDTTFTVNKVWSPASGASVSVTVTCTGGGTVVEGSQSVSTASPKTWNIQGYVTTPTCTATESPIPTGYSASGSPAGTCSGAAPGNCTITNTQNSAQLHVAKTVIGGTLGDVTIQVSCTTGSAAVNDATATPGGDTADFTITGFSSGATCTVTETAVPGYTFSAGDCPSVVLSPGGNYTCTVTNTRNDATFTVNKVWSPASAASVSVTVSCTGGGTVVEGAQSVSTASPKTWNIQGYSTTPTCTATEAIPSGYSASGSPAGTCSGTATGSCTITNTRNDTTFTVHKAWIPASGASVSVTVSCTGVIAVTGGTQSVSTASPQTWGVQGYTGASTCTATETVPSGYTASGSPAGTCTAGVPAPGSCTITNTRSDATFTVNKVWSPASAASVPVTVTCTGGGTVVEGSQNVSTASPKTWNIQGFSSTPTCTATETIPTGYSASGSPAGTCSGTATGSCTITNTRNDTTFTVNKVWSPASAASVSVTVTCTGGGTVVEGAQSVSTASPKTWNIQGYVTTPTCTATEAVPSGYTADGSPAGTCSGAAPGSCTITNTRNDATFTVNKVWSPASAASVSVTVTCTGGGTVVEGAQSVSTASPKTWNIQGYVTTPTCTATEAVPSGYSASGSPAGTCSGTATGSCTITNTRNDATFTVNKVWVPASGASVSVTVTCTGGGTVVEGAQSVSTASPKTWNIQGYVTTPTCTATESPIPAGYTASGSPAGTCSGTATGSCTITNTAQGSIIVQKTTNPAADPQSFTVNLTPGGSGSVTDATDYTFTGLSGGTYALAEVLPAGWQAGSTSCSDGSPISAIVLSAGEVVTCVLNNTKLGTIIIEKTTNPAADPTSFPVALTGPTPGSSSMTDATDAMFINRAPGGYTATETLSAPWVMTGVTCSGGSPTPGANSVSFTLAAGATVTCTFSNQTSATFNVNKDYQPNDPTPVTVSLSCASGAAAATDSSAQDLGDDANFTVTGYSGNPMCTATESGVVSGYGNSTCQALLSIGSCTIINTQNTTTFTVNKVWSPASAASVSVTVACTGGGTVVEGAQSVSTASPKTWNINGFSSTPTCTATEAVPSGYTGSGSPAGTCSGTAPGNCTITNTRNDTTFTVNKVWSPASAASVSVTVTCTGGGTVVEGAQNVSTASPQTWNIQGYVTAPTCTATESVPSGYTGSGSPAGTCSGTAPGNCTITNTRNDTIFTVNKVWSPASGASVSVTVTCTGGGTVVEGAQSVSTASPKTWNIQGFVTTPTCTATESPIPAGYTASGSPAGTCSGAAPGSCTITNTQEPQMFTVNKVWNPASAAPVSVTVTCTGGGSVVEGAQNVSTASPKTWTVIGYTSTPTCTATEAVPSGYNASGSPAGTCSGVATGSCTITNTRNDTTFTVNKVWVPASGASVPVTVTCTGGGTVVEGSQNVSTASPKTWNIQGFVTTPTCTATETIPSGYTASGTPAGTCSGAAPGQCTITNTEIPPATFNVIKDFVPDNAAAVVILLACSPTGVVTTIDGLASEADDANFTVANFTGDPTCTASESGVPSGYSSATCSALLSVGTCTIVNNATTTPSQTQLPESITPNPAAVGGVVDLEVYSGGGDGGSNSMALVLAVMVLALVSAVGAAWAVKRR